MKRFLAFLPFALFLFPLFSQCLHNDILLTTQAQIDSFSINYPECTQILKNLKISGDSSITNLQGLSSLQKVSDFTIENNPNLTSLAGLNNLERTIGFFFRNNNSITDFSGLENLEFTADIVVEYNDSLTSFQGLNNVKTTSFLEIRYNPSLSSIAELDSLKSVMQIHIEGNNSLTSLTGLEGLTSLHSLFIGNTLNLPNLNGLHNLNELVSLLFIEHNGNLTDLTALSNLSLVGSIILNNNDRLKNVSGFDNITSTKAGIEMIGNDSLVDLTAFSNLVSLTTNGNSVPLRIRSNHSLATLAGLDNIDPASISSLEIYQNMNLSTCEVQSVCDYLGIATNVANITNNNTGCNTRPEVEAVCNGSTSIQNDFGSALVFYPNPTKNKVFIELGDVYNQIQVEARNLTGQRVLGQVFQQTDQLILEFSQPAGIYFIKIKTQDGKNAVIKIMKE